MAAFSCSWETCPKSRLATQRAEKAPKALEDGGSAPWLLKDTAGEKTRPFHYEQWREMFLCWDGDFGCCFVFCFSSTVTDPKGCGVFPAGPPSPASLLHFLEYSAHLCPFFSRCSWVSCPKRTKAYRHVFHELAGLSVLPFVRYQRKFSAWAF